MKQILIKTLLIIASVVMLISIGIIIGLNIQFERKSPEFVMVHNERTMDMAYEGQMVKDNFWKFVDASYITVGDRPDCLFYKIASEVPRHHFNLENFYIEDDESVMHYHDDEGNKLSKIVIDISEYQQYIDWEAVKSAGVDMAIMRVGYRGYGTGKMVEDAMFRQHVTEATEAGLRVGVYFFSQAISYEEGIEEAQFVIDIIKEYEIKGPVAIDTEYVDSAEARTYGLDVTLRTDSVVGFCETVKAAGYIPMVYSNRNWFVQCLDMSRLGEYKLWLAQYSNAPNFPYFFSGWQYTDQGNIAGINGNVDLNVWVE